MDTKTSPLTLLADPSLLKTDALINGNWTAGQASNPRFAVTDPATGQELAQVANLGPIDAAAALSAAEKAWPAWRAKTAKERAAVMMKWFALLHAHADDLARIMTAEQGKPLAEARGEVGYGASFIEWFAEEARRVYGAEQTPLCALAVAELAQRAGMPAGVLNILTADGDNSIEIGKVLCSSDVVRHLSFTGSTEVGRILARQCAGTIKKISLELGGNAPFIVFDDADIDSAVEGAMVSKYRNAGQTCVCANRLYVQAAVYDEFVAKLAVKAGAIQVGNGFEAGVNQGPLIDDAAIAKVESHVADAVAKGARVVVGGQRVNERFFTPTVLADVTGEMLCAKEETFGPVAPVFRFETEAEAIALANDTEFGLASYFYSRDIGRVFRVGEALEYGMVGVNTGLISTAEVPFGGVKQSGLGREGARQGMDDYLEVKYLCLGDINR